jgi:nucleotide-binding universal stress UspA family protein
MQSPSKILVPVDFSDSSRAALDVATSLGSRLGAAVDVLYVWPTQHGAESKKDLLLDFMRSDPGHTMMDWLADCEVRGDVEAHGRVAPGSRRAVPDAIVEAVENGAYDLVVMATHGRHGLSLLWKPSVTEEVMRRAPCPVLTVRAPEDDTPPPPSALDRDLGTVWGWPS